ncbi:unnamed protein product [Lepeophtheirus salmonis]|uniref:(salmon louse) hypothetical protein n=1 Tax=Lepeophtheirus salmonis TaxID=72036 RepID=A0A7R8HAK7_LEPSM|nr:unnamed protein product [Lepeophtheirus salmonis]CAF2958010.1 unnamed protein product [Lepeophtheirus salmonis]
MEDSNGDLANKRKKSIGSDDLQHLADSHQVMKKNVILFEATSQVPRRLCHSFLVGSPIEANRTLVGDPDRGVKFKGLHEDDRGKNRYAVRCPCPLLKCNTGMAIRQFTRVSV